jgi:hypothetical protein
MEACIEPALAALAIYKKGKFVFAQEKLPTDAVALGRGLLP